ncbi:MAG: sigma-70 family RNA polymerase sigma factor [Lachnospiraceae bacterium]|nr:sigma-70 family RNA polymerase sigma factor [Lachnospiraceae bacterium]
MLEDSKIIELFYERSEQAIVELTRKYGHIFTKVADNILNNKADAEECVNDAYLGAWNTIPPKKPERLLSYVCRIVRNQAIKKYHANTATKRNSTYDIAFEELEGCFPNLTLVEEQYSAKETARYIDKFLEGLDKESRIMFVRRYWYADSVADIARMFNTSSHNVSVKLFRIRDRLKKYLLKEGVTL